MHNAENVSTLQCNSSVNSLCITPCRTEEEGSNNTVCAGCEDGCIVLWKLFESGESSQQVNLFDVLGFHASSINGIDITGDRLFAGTHGGQLIMCSLSSRHWLEKEMLCVHSFSSPIYAVEVINCFTSSNAVVLCVGLEDGTVQLLKYLVSEGLLRVLLQLSGSDVDPIFCVASTRHGDCYHVYTGSKDAHIRHYSVSRELIE